MSLSKAEAVLSTSESLAPTEYLVANKQMSRKITFHSAKWMVLKERSTFDKWRITCPDSSWRYNFKSKFAQWATFSIQMLVRLLVAIVIKLKLYDIQFILPSSILQTFIYSTKIYWMPGAARGSRDAIK